jgi:hypothetical protein
MTKKRLFGVFQIFQKHSSMYIKRSFPPSSPESILISYQHQHFHLLSSLPFQPIKHHPLSNQRPKSSIMHTKQILALFSFFSSMALAAPAGEVEDLSARDAGDLAKRSATFNMYGGDRCTDQVHGFFHPDGAGYRCYPVPAGKRSIHLVGRYVSHVHTHTYASAHAHSKPIFLFFPLLNIRVDKQTRKANVCLVQILSCNVYTWSGTNCRGGSALVTQGDGCRNILYGSVSVDC